MGDEAPVIPEDDPADDLGQRMVIEAATEKPEPEPEAEPGMRVEAHWKRLIDSDSDADSGSNSGKMENDINSNSEKPTKNDLHMRKVGDSDLDSESEFLVEREVRKTAGSLSGSDDEPITASKKRNMTKRVNKRIESDSSSDDGISTSPRTEETLKVRLERMDHEPLISGTQKSNSSPKRWENLVDSDDEEELLPLPEYYEGVNPSYSRPGRNDSDSDDSSVGVNKSRSNTSKSKSAKKEKKLTQKQRDELRKELTSKTQKMVREAPLSLPYIKPKPQTLKEFLERRNKTKAEFYTTLKESKTLNLKKLGLPSKTLVNDWVSASVNEPAKLTPEKNIEITIEDFNLTDDEDIDITKANENSVKKKLFEESEVEFENETATIRDLIEDMLEKVDNQEQSIPKPMSPLSIVKMEKPDDGYEAVFETDSELEEEFEMVDLASDDEPPLSATNKSIATVIDTTVKSEPNTATVNTGKEQEVIIHEVPIEQTPADTSAADDFQAKEDELNAYLNAAAKPKKPTLREMLLQSAEYQKAKMSTNLKPTIKCDAGSRKGFIELTSPSKKEKKASNGIQQLMDRYIKHTAVYKKPKEQHYKVHLSTKEEDSQGNQNITINEIDYVQRDENEDTEVDNNSPIRAAPGSKLTQFREKMEANIRAKKIKEYEERQKMYAIYNDEKVLEEKQEEEEEELVDEFSTESEPELTDEEMEAIRSARRKKKKKIKSAFVEEEAEDSDGPNQTGNEESEEEAEMVDIGESSTEDEPVLEKTYRRVQKLDDSSDEEANAEDTGDNEVPLKELSPMKDPFAKSLRDELVADWDTDSDEFDENTEMPSTDKPNTDTVLPKHVDFLKPETRVDKTTDSNLKIGSSQSLETPSKPSFMESNSQITPAQREIMKLVDSETPILSSQNTESPIQEWKLPILPTKSSRFSGNVSTPFLPRLDSDAALDAFEEDMQNSSQKTPVVSKEISKLFDNSSSKPNTPVQLENLMDLCSGKFPSQAPKTPAESQCPEFEFVDEENETDRETQSQTQIQTPVNTLPTKTPIRSFRNLQETPRGSEKEKVSKTRLFMNNRNAPSDEVSTGGGIIVSDDEEGPSSSVIIKPIIKRKKRRLEFSDDENSESETKPEESESELEPESDAEISEKEYDSEENEIVKPKKVFKGLKSRLGGIRKEFVENEAELSGSEEGSGDEDERGLDELEMEEADAEDIDEDKMRDELGKAHLRHLLDEDQKDVRALQDALLEDGDLHGDGTARERQFKWKNIDSLMVDVSGRVHDDLKIDDEDETERLRLEEKAEKIRWMKENSQSIGEEEEEEIDSQKLFLENSQVFRLGKSTLKKIQSHCSFMETSNSNSCSQFTKITTAVSWEKSSSSKDVNSQGSCSNGPQSNLTTKSFFASPDDPLLKMKRGSFLSRGITTLTRLAEMTKGSDGTSNVKTNSRNFVFAVVTPPAPDGSKGTGDTHSKASKKPAARQRNQKNDPPKKMPRMDRSFDSMDSSIKGASIFKHY